MNNFIFGYGSTIVVAVDVIPAVKDTPDAFGIGLIDVGSENPLGEKPTDEFLIQMGLYQDGQFDPNRFETVLWFRTAAQRDAVKAGLTGVTSGDFVLIPNKA